jgi:hypothetical protein
VKSDVFKNRNLNDKLVEKLQETDEDAGRDTARREINGFLTAYRREITVSVV